jgi:hypothetical protein
MSRSQAIHFFAVGAFLLLAPPTFSQGVGGKGQILHQWEGNAAEDRLGCAVAAVGDLNQDGFDDILIGAYGVRHGGVSLSGSVYLRSGADGSILRQWHGQAVGAALGYSVASAGDLNGDGTNDILIGAPYADVNGNSTAGAAMAYSGVDGSLLHRWLGTTAGDKLGLAVAGAGDVNADGFDDVVVGNPGSNNGKEVYVFSGVDGSILHTWGTAGLSDQHGSTLAGVGDINGDGFSDVMVGAPLNNNSNNLTASGKVLVYSGADGSILYTWRGWSAYAYFGHSVAGAGDVNGDGTNDLIVGAITTDRNGLTDSGSADVYSGADGTLLFRWNGEAADDQLGAVVASAGDINHDGHSDLLVSATRTSPSGNALGGTVYLYSGIDGVLLHRIHGNVPNLEFGYALAGGGDLDGDGFPEILVGGKKSSSGFGAYAGAAIAYSFHPQLTASVTEVSTTVVTQVDFQLDFATATAGYPYKVLLSLADSGVFRRGTAIPLREDFMVRASYAGNYPFTTYAGLHGILDAQGHASASISIAAGEIHPILTGRTVHFAAVTSPSGNLPAFSSSIAVPLTVTP